MKKTAENRYPHSATLFRFCKEALEIRYEGNVKVIDQDVGAILGYDPADCSHWKKGKKNIRALSTLKSIADHLQIDERLLIDITSGRIPLEEAVFEFKGYGTFSMQGQQIEGLKKEFFKDPTRWQRDDEVLTFEELFKVDRSGIMDVVEQILDSGKFDEPPIYLPEIFKLLPEIRQSGASTQPQQNTLSNDEIIGGVSSYSEPIEETSKLNQNGEMRPYLRFLLAKQLLRSLIACRHPYVKAFWQTPEEVIDILGNIFAGALLMPTRMLAQEVDQVDGSIDLIEQLAKSFWVSKSLVNKRLCDYLENFS